MSDAALTNAAGFLRTRLNSPKTFTAGALVAVESIRLSGRYCGSIALASSLLGAPAGRGREMVIDMVHPEAKAARQSSHRHRTLPNPGLYADPAMRRGYRHKRTSNRCDGPGGNA